jgi:hypothetical protein
MNPAPGEPRNVPFDVLPPVPPDAAISHRPPAPLSALKTFYHPASGVVILGIDLLVFGPEMLSGFLDLPVMCAVAFAVTFPLVYLIQTRWSRDGVASSLGKAFLGAFLAGLPFSITGTIFGAAVIALSGLPRNPVEAYKKITEPRPKLEQ